MLTSRKLVILKTALLRIEFFRGQSDPWRKFDAAWYLSRHGIDLYWTFNARSRSLFVRWYPHIH